MGMVLSFGILLVVNKFLPYKERSYMLDNNGVTISRGRKTKFYSWNDFECFYPYSERFIASHSQDPAIEEKREKIYEVDKSIEGEIFYLRKKPNNILDRLHKTFVVIYSKADNFNEVNNFLVNYLERKAMQNSTDLGLVFYEFK